MLSNLRPHRILAAVTMLIALAACIYPLSARGDYFAQSVTLDQSNVFKDGVAYGSVLIEAYDGVGKAGGGLNAGEVRLTYSAALIADYTSLSKSFGIQHLGFNTDLVLAEGQITGPTGWKLSSAKNLDGFGKFTWNLDGTAKGGSRINPASVLISGLGANATAAHFLFGSAGSGKSSPEQGSVYFAMHVAGFESDNKSAKDGHYVGGSGVETPPPPPGGDGDVQPTPEPSAFLLGGIAMGCLTLARFVSRRRRDTLA